MNDGACPAYGLPIGDTCTDQRKSSQHITDITKEKHNDERIDKERKQRRPPRTLPSLQSTTCSGTACPQGW